MTTWSEESFMDALDNQQPDWYIRCANHHDLEDFARNVIQRSGTHYYPGDPSKVDRAIEKLRYEVSLRLVMPVRAAVHAGLVTEGAPDA